MSLPLPWNEFYIDFILYDLRHPAALAFNLVIMRDA